MNAHPNRKGEKNGDSAVLQTLPLGVWWVVAARNYFAMKFQQIKQGIGEIHRKFSNPGYGPGAYASGNKKRAKANSPLPVSYL